MSRPSAGTSSNRGRSELWRRKREKEKNDEEEEEDVVAPATWQLEREREREREGVIWKGRVRDKFMWLPTGQNLNGKERKRKRKKRKKGQRDEVMATWLLLIGPFQNRNMRIAKRAFRYF